jgi:uroporphyrinogen-III decarboxylase
MMPTHREHFFSVLEGKRPASMPFFPDITDWYVAQRTPPGQPRPYGPAQFIPDDAEFHQWPGTLPEKYQRFTLFEFYRHFDWGFHVHIGDWYKKSFSGGIQNETKVEGNQRYQRLLTPKGTLTQMDLLASDGTWSRKEFYVKELRDLEALRCVVENTHFSPRYERVEELRRQMGDWGQGDLVLSRSPFGKLVHEYMGFEKVIYALADEPDPLLEFMRIQEQKDLELVELATKAPERLVIMSDHTDEILISPPQWVQYCVPYYQKITAILHRAGKFVSTHLDGNFKGYFKHLAKPGFDLLDGCTPAPMFNYHVEELAAALPPNMYAFVGVPATLFCQQLPTEEILQFAERILAAFKGRAIINVGDILPPNGDIEQVVALGEHVRYFRF